VTRLELAPQAQTQIRRIAEWWRAHRPAAPELFAHELASALDTLVGAPMSGARYAERRGVTIRRLLLRKSSYHVYFSYDAGADVVAVRAYGTRREAWGHRSRRSGTSTGSGCDLLDKRRASMSLHCPRSRRRPGTGPSGSRRRRGCGEVGLAGLHRVEEVLRRVTP
jgi:plasmid stabilization system protein ParE